MPNYDEICAGLCELLQPHAGGGQTVTEDTELVGDLGLSSLKVLDLLMEIEDRFDVTVPMNVLPDVRTVRDFAGQLQSLMDKSS